MSEIIYRISAELDGWRRSVEFTEGEIDHGVISRSVMIEALLDETGKELIEHIKKNT